MVFDTPIVQILSLSVELEGAKNIHVFKGLIWSFGGCWRILIWVWDLELDFDMVSCLYYTCVTNFGSLS